MPIARSCIGGYILRGMAPLNIKTLRSSFSVVRLEAGDPVPAWALTGEFFSVTGTQNELSVVCESSLVPDGIQCESGWRALEVQGPLQFDQVGILAALSHTLAGKDISIFAVSTYDTDYILLKNRRLQDAVLALRSAGHKLID